jgi:hypothetical protein
MADGDIDKKLNEIEQKNLQTLIATVETALAASTPGTRSLLENALNNAKARVGVLETKIKEAHEKSEGRAREDAAIAALVANETALSEQEREEYGEFLRKEYFTKRDFAGLEHFYAQTWERLSEGGKDEMSQRVWEGIRRDEYAFSELPESVRKKEAERLFGQIVSGKSEASMIEQIPSTDRDDFVGAFGSGDRQHAYKILDRESFAKNVAVKASGGAKLDVVKPVSLVESQADISLDGVQFGGGVEPTDSKISSGLPPASESARVR